MEQRHRIINIIADGDNKTLKRKQLSKFMLAMAAIAIGVEAAAVSVLSKEQSQEIKTVTYEPIPIMADFEWAADQGQISCSGVQLLRVPTRARMVCGS